MIREHSNVLKFPIRLLVSKEMPYEFNINLGHDLKYKLRHVARNFPHIYHRKVTFPTKPNLSKELGMTVGRWLFGIPGYKGHIIAYDNKAFIPLDAPDIVKRLMELIQKRINSNNKK